MTLFRIGTPSTNQVVPDTTTSFKPALQQPTTQTSVVVLSSGLQPHPKVESPRPRMSLDKLAIASLHDASSAPQKAATAGGHANSFVRVGPSHIAKLTSQREAEIYRKYGDTLRGVIPDTLSLEQAAKLPGLTSSQSEALRALRDKAAAAEQEVVVMEALGAKIPEANKRELDIKIGARTASRSELIDAGMSSAQAFKKKVKLTAADLIRGSRAIIGEHRGFTLAGRTQAGEQLDYSRNAAGRFSESRIREMLDGPPDLRPQLGQRLLEQLEHIQACTKDLPVTFVASSILISLDRKNPGNSVARLIDLAHPVQPQGGQADFDKLKAQFQQGLGNLISLVRQSTL